MDEGPPQLQVRRLHRARQQDRARIGHDYTGVFDFGHNADNPISSGNGFANALLGVVNSYSELDNRVDRDNLHWYSAAYVQDSWRHQLADDARLRLARRAPRRVLRGSPGELGFRPRSVGRLAGAALCTGRRAGCRPRATRPARSANQAAIDPRFPDAVPLARVRRFDRPGHRFDHERDVGQRDEQPPDESGLGQEGRLVLRPADVLVGAARRIRVGRVRRRQDRHSRVHGGVLQLRRGPVPVQRRGARQPHADDPQRDDWPTSPRSRRPARPSRKARRPPRCRTVSR